MQAVKALNSITPKDIGALKALKNPPDIVKRIFDCVLLLRFYPLDKPQWQEVKGAQVRSLLAILLCPYMCTIDPVFVCCAAQHARQACCA